nr:energy transducer TonB [Rhodoferax lacus]
MQRFRPSQTMALMLCVVLLHVLGLWALQSGLLLRAVEAVVSVDVISELVELPKPRVEQPPAPPPSPPKALQKPMPSQPAPSPSVAAPAALPVAIADATPAPNAVSGVTAPQAAAPLLAAPVSPSTASPVPAPRVELPSSDADYLHNPKPEYPGQSRRRAEQGKVLLRVFIGADGLAQKAEIKTSSGFARLDQAALATVLAWRYAPGKRAGVPEAMWFDVPINFVLE